MASVKIDIGFKPRSRPRSATPERRWTVTTSEDGHSSAYRDEYRDGEFDEAGCYGSHDSGFVADVFWKVVDIFTWVLQVVGLVISIGVWIIMIIASLSYSLVRWSMTLRGLLVLSPLSLGALICGIFAALEDRGIASPMYGLIEHHAGNLSHILQEAQLSQGTSTDKTLVGGLLARRSALELAAGHGYIDVVHALLNIGKGSDVGWTFGPSGSLGSATPLTAAAQNGHATAVAALLEAGTSADSGWKYGPFGVLGKSTPLAGASKNGHVETMQLLLKANAQVDAGWAFGTHGVFGTAAPLRGAAWNGHAAAVQLLLDAGALPDVGSSVGPLGLFWSDTPLMGAAWNGDLPSVQALLAAGASLEFGLGDEPLRKAALNGHVQIVKTLLDAGTRPRVSGEDGHEEALTTRARIKAVQVAGRNGHEEVVQLLKASLKKGNREKPL